MHLSHIGKKNKNEIYIYNVKIKNSFHTKDLYIMIHAKDYLIFHIVQNIKSSSKIIKK